MKKTGRRFGLGAKMNAMLIACILLVSLGLVAITYRVYCRKVDSFYREETQRAAREVANGYIAPYYVMHLREMIDTDGFREVRRRAEAAQDASIIEEWMRRQPPVWYEMDDFDPDG
ncbi:MAG: hypothetical protein E7317_09670 [Clostridiales bacterium]|nr:hypothetical protein [Clostridiales bacterium]